MDCDCGEVPVEQQTPEMQDLIRNEEPADKEQT